MSGVDTLWYRPAHGPRDPDGYVFILRALDQMGREMFGVEWTGREPLTSLPHRLPVKRPATPSAPDLNRVELLLASVPGWKAQSTTIIGSATSVSPRLIGPPAFRA